MQGVNFQMPSGGQFWVAVDSPCALTRTRGLKQQPESSSTTRTTPSDALSAAARAGARLETRP